MKAGILASAAFLTVLLAGCVSSPGRLLEVQVGDEWLKPYQRTEATIIFYNRGDGIYRDVRLEMVDDGILDGTCEGSSARLMPGDVMVGYCSLRSGDVTGEARVEYHVVFSSSIQLAVPNIEVVSEDEWTRREYRGNELRTLAYSVSDGNVELSASLNDPVPLREGKGTILKVTIANRGPGYIDAISPGSLRIEDPSGIIERCYSMKKSGTVFELSETLPPVNENFQEIDCYVNPKSSEVLNIYDVKIHLDYNYRIMDTFTLRVVE